jgi:hypothetical protein
MTTPMTASRDSRDRAAWSHTLGGAKSIRRTAVGRRGSRRSRDERQPVRHEPVREDGEARVDRGDPASTSMAVAMLDETEPPGVIGTIPRIAPDRYASRTSDGLGCAPTIPTNQRTLMVDRWGQASTVSGGAGHTR